MPAPAQKIATSATEAKDSATRRIQGCFQPPCENLSWSLHEQAWSQPDNATRSNAYREVQRDQQTGRECGSQWKPGPKIQHEMHDEHDDSRWKKDP